MNVCMYEYKIIHGGHTGRKKPGQLNEETCVQNTSCPQVEQF